MIATWWLRGRSKGRWPSGQFEARDTIKLRGHPKAFATKRAVETPRVAELAALGMVTLQTMLQWTIRSQALRARTGGGARLRVQFTD